MLHRCTLFLAGSLTVCLSLGCGGGSSVSKETLVPVSGTLLVDGQPLDGVIVSFIPQGKNRRGGSGKTDSSGAFTITDLDQKGPGLPAGSYSLTYSRMRLADGSAPPDIPDPAKLQVETLPAVLTLPNPSPVTQVQIPKEGNTKLELKISTK